MPLLIFCAFRNPMTSMESMESMERATDRHRGCGPDTLINPSRDALAKPSMPTSVSPLVLTEMSKMGANCTTPLWQ